MKALVIPTNRPEHAKAFFEAWGRRGGWDHAYVIEDGTTKSFDATTPGDPRVSHFAWDTIAEAAGDEAWIFSKRDSAIRCFGFWAAVRDGVATSILTLDDDCLPIPQEVGYASTFFDRHLEAMAEFRKWTPSFGRLRTRGLPYRNLGVLDTVMANMGGWTGNLDYDAVQTLTGMTTTTMSSPAVQTSWEWGEEYGNHLIPAGQYFPVCGMNLCFKAGIAPLFYFPLMGDGQPYRRFDDIWAGVIAKKIFDHLGLQFSVGEPFVRHARASDPFVNLVKEAPGIAANEHFWKEIDAISLAGIHTPLECVARIGTALQDNDDTYNHKLGQALMGWKRLWDSI